MYDLDEKKSEELLFQKVIKNVIRRRIEQNLPTLLTHKKSTTFESTTQDSHIDWFWKDFFIQFFMLNSIVYKYSLTKMGSNNG